MTEISSLLKRMSDSFIPVVAMGIFMVLSMSLLSAATENSSQFGRLHLVLVIINVLGLITLVGLIGVNIIRLIRQYRRKAMGSRLTARMMVIFVIISVAPVSVVFYFSLGFIQRSIDTWFDVGIDESMRDALNLSRASLDLHMRGLVRSTRAMANDIGDVPDELLLLSLNDLRNESAATELTLLTQAGRVIASSSDDTSAIIPNRPDESILLAVKNSKSYAGLAPIGDIGLHIRVAIAVPLLDSASEPRVLYALYPVVERINELANNVELAFGQYKKLIFLREPLKDSFTLTLSLVLFVSLLTAIWAAFFSAQRLVSPIRILAIGTRAVAAGNYEKKLPITSNDELGSLVKSFSDMTDNIAKARDEAKISQTLVERERAYLQVVLGKLSSGVLTLDSQLHLRAVNTSASQILEIDLEKMIGRPLHSIIKQSPNLEDFVDVLVTHLSNNDDEWREEVVLVRPGRNKSLMCQGAQLPGIGDIKEGNVVVFDDVTTLIHAQRDAAWGEVARRLAHEIKNPLTPIQLSAERLRRKYLDKTPIEDAEVLDRSTHTIVQQVQAMKEMVKAFSEYARAPALELKPLRLEDLVTEVLDLYRGDDTGVAIEIECQPNVPMVEADPGRLRQLTHNLLKNAMESMKDMTDARVKVSISCLRENKAEYDCSHVELRIIDNGPGIPGHLLDTIFDPYTSTKTKGSGLGLAVVKRIVEEHSGDLFAENNTTGGVTILIRLPSIDERDKPLSDLSLQVK